MHLLKMNVNGQVTIPAELRKRLHLHVGDYLQVEIDKDALKFLPAKVISPSQNWFWSKEWQKKEKEAQEDFKKGCYKKFPNTNKAIEHLKSLCK
ncbi:MAG: AbrB/MazE/SpoVT family DNA-binding domain-containing protein [Candidatus Omnitrophica bacterium]|nr:AbrB/MazE/SpoVT family DNA-binding domain-containing protein [Candidatus Omnitrophota bacterium]MBU1133295.1 AbrB/MazE/SpoVT family DNA-binding domain-containing protein [Candidatus Omnitrophota bacterium]MBU1810630.1 AbrB/MazE/SpoVT family DNA-binding domain-containing protein [Candidatus Omnitrophota bacterium]